MSFKLFDSISPKSKGALVQAMVYIKEPNFDEKLQNVMLDLMSFGTAAYKFDSDVRITNISYTQLTGKTYGKSPIEGIR